MSYIGKKNGNPNTDFLEAGGELENHDLVNVDSSGNVGIGTDSPSYKTHISSGSSGAWANGDNDELFIENSSNAGITIGTPSTNHGSIAFADNASSTRGLIRYDHSTDSLRINVSGSEKMRIDSSGHLIVPNGITLGTSVGTYNADNTLDDYEEGTWTPTAIQGVSGFSVTKATYTKIGNQVTVYFYIGSITGKTSSQLMIGGLPFTVGTSVYMSGVCESDGGGDVGITRAYGGLTDLWFYDTATAPRSDYTGTDLGGGLRGSVTYFTN